MEIKRLRTQRETAEPNFINRMQEIKESSCILVITTKSRETHWYWTTLLNENRWRQKLRKKLKHTRIEWKWTHSIPISMEDSESSSKRQVHNTNWYIKKLEQSHVSNLATHLKDLKPKGYPKRVSGKK